MKLEIVAMLPFSHSKSLYEYLILRRLVSRGGVGVKKDPESNVGLDTLHMF